MNPIHLSFRYSETDYTQAFRANLLTKVHLRFDFILILILFGLSIFFWHIQDYWWSIISFAVPTVMLIVMALGWFILPPFYFRRDPKFKDVYSLEFSSEGIHFRTTNIDSNLQWSLYTRVLIDKYSYLLYYGKNAFTIIPKRFFESAEQQRAFEQLLTQHIPKIIRRGK